MTDSRRIETVQPGDSLSAIAKRIYNDPSRWSEIYEANKALIKNPDVITVGMELVIPNAPAIEAPAAEVAAATAPETPEASLPLDDIEVVTRTQPAMPAANALRLQQREAAARETAELLARYENNELQTPEARKQLQQALNAAELTGSRKLSIDGIIGRNSNAAIAAYKAQHASYYEAATTAFDIEKAKQATLTAAVAPEPEPEAVKVELASLSPDEIQPKTLTDIAPPHVTIEPALEPIGDAASAKHAAFVTPAPNAARLKRREAIAKEAAPLVARAMLADIPTKEARIQTQQLLNEAELAGVKLDVDGVIGTESKKAMAAFQEQYPEHYAAAAANVTRQLAQEAFAQQEEQMYLHAELGNALNKGLSSLDTEEMQRFEAALSGLGIDMNTDGKLTQAESTKIGQYLREKRPTSTQAFVRDIDRLQNLEQLNNQQLTALQSNLTTLGISVGAVDGKWGIQSADGLKLFNELHHSEAAPITDTALQSKLLNKAGFSVNRSLEAAMAKAAPLFERAGLSTDSFTSHHAALLKYHELQSPSEPLMTQFHLKGDSKHRGRYTAYDTDAVKAWGDFVARNPMKYVAKSAPLSSDAIDITTAYGGNTAGMGMFAGIFDSRTANGPHEGADFIGHMSETKWPDNVAAAAGVALYADNLGYGYGNVVVVGHADRSQTLYAHGGKPYVKAGQILERGTPLMQMSDTGFGRAHLHYEEIDPNGMKVPPRIIGLNHPDIHKDSRGRVTGKTALDIPITNNMVKNDRNRRGHPFGSWNDENSIDVNGRESRRVADVYSTPAASKPARAIPEWSEVRRPSKEQDATQTASTDIPVDEALTPTQLPEEIVARNQLAAERS